MLSFVHTVLVVLHLTNHSSYIPLSISNLYHSATITATAALALRSYLALTDIENQYLVSKLTIDASTRFREQRNFYLSTFALVLSVLLMLAQRQTAKVNELHKTQYALQRKLDSKTQ